MLLLTQCRVEMFTVSQPRCIVNTTGLWLHRRQRRRGRDPQYLTCGGRPVLTTPQYFDKCFSLQRNFWIPQVSVIFICNAPSVQFLIQQLNKTVFEYWYFYKVYHTTTIHGTHMNLKNNTPRLHHITPFWDEKFINFPQTPLPSPPTALRLSRLRRSTCDPQCSSGVGAHGRDILLASRILGGYASNDAD